MDFPTIFDVLDRLAFLRGGPAVAVVLLAGALALVVWDVFLLRRRDGDAPRFMPFAPLAFPAMLTVYLIGGLLLVEVLDPRLAVVTVMTGVFVALILLVTGVQTRWGRPLAGLSDAEMARLGRSMRQGGPLVFTDRALLRLALVAVALLGAWWLARSPGTLLPFVPEERAYLEAAILGLAGLGLVGLAASAEPLPAGVGLLLFLSGFTLFYGLVDPSIIMVVALIILQLAVALAVAYLAQARYLPADVVE